MALQFAETELIAENPDPSNCDYFGWDVALDGQTAVVGSPAVGKTDPPVTGAAHVFVREDGHWTHQAALVPSMIPVNSNVGHGVGIDNDRIIVGNRLNMSATVWKRVGSIWTEENAWLSGAGRFGHSVEIQGNHAVFGAPFAEKIFSARRNGSSWNGLVELEIPEGVDGISMLGCDVDVDAGWIVGGAYGSDRVQIWKWNSQTELWDHHSYLDGSEGDNFGSSCDLDAGRLIVGASAADADDGKAYIYKYNSDTTTWEEETAISGPSGAAELFGSGVRLDDDRAVIGARGADLSVDQTEYLDAGAAYVYKFDDTDWNPEATITPQTHVAHQTFGNAVDVDGERFLIGAPYGDDPGTGRLAGKAYVFDIIPIPGDANRDWKVTDADAAILATHWQQSGASWEDGDFNDDGSVTDADAAILATHWQEGVPTEHAVPVPEPGAPALLAIALLTLAAGLARRVRTKNG